MQTFRMRSSVLAVAIAVSLGACGDQKPAQKISPNPVGNTIEVEETVTATRESTGETRPLQSDSAVFADDVVETSTSGSAVIHLAHNDVDWQLGPSLKMRVDKSAAWRAPRRQSAPVARDQEKDDSAAAGRDGTREAGEAQATAIPNQGKPAPVTRAVRAKKPDTKVLGQPRANSDPESASGGGDDLASSKKETKPSGIRSYEGDSDSDAPDGSRAEPLQASAKSPKDDIGFEVRKIARQCYSKLKTTAKGKIAVTIRIGKNDRISKVTTKADKLLEPIKRCIDKSLVGKTASGAVGSKTFNVTFK